MKRTTWKVKLEIHIQRKISYASLQRTIEQARKIARGLGNTIDNKLKRYYKYLDAVFDSLNSQKKDQVLNYADASAQLG